MESKVNHQIEDRFDFQIRAMTAIKKEIPASPRFSESLGVLSESEMIEADVACAKGMTGEEFGRLIAKRDRLGQLESPVPIDFPKPLSLEDSTIIRLLTDMYVGKDQPLVKAETNDRVTLHVPRIKRVFKSVTVEAR